MSYKCHKKMTSKKFWMLNIHNGILTGYEKRCIIDVSKWDEKVPERRQVMASKVWKWYFFEDGYAVCTRGLDKVELQAEVRKHGKLLGTRPA